MPQIRTLYVKETSVGEIHQQWKHPDTTLFQMAALLRIRVLETCYVRCTKQGVVNWNSSPVYRVEELIERNHVKIVKDERHNNPQTKAK